MEKKTIDQNLMQTKTYQTGIHSIIDNNTVVNGVPNETVYVSSESELSLYAGKPAGTVAATYGLGSMWQLGADGEWIAMALGGGGGGGSFDPDITNPQDGDTLVYDGTEQKWVNGSGGGSGGVLIVNDVSHTLDKTWKEINDAGFAVLYYESRRGSSIAILSEISESDGTYYLVFYSQAEQQILYYSTTSETGYPVYFTPGES